MMSTIREGVTESWHPYKNISKIGQKSWQEEGCSKKNDKKKVDEICERGPGSMILNFAYSLYVHRNLDPLKR